jgi:transposase InsO family protein
VIDGGRGRVPQQPGCLCDQYLFIRDCYSRMIVGWQLATHLRTDSVLDAVEMANGLRPPAPG